MFMLLSELRKAPHLSASSISDYIECSLLYKLGRIDRLAPEYHSDALEFGSVIHLVLGDYYQEKISGNKMTLKHVHELFETYWRQTAEKNDTIKYAKGTDFKSYLMQGCDLLTAWYNKLPDDNFQVIATEEAFRFTIPGIAVPIIGAMDLVEQDQSSLIITDFKTTGRAYGADEVDRNMQLTLYQLAAKANGYAGFDILLRFDCLIKTQKPKFEQYYTIRTEIDEKRLIRKIHQVWEGISKQVFIPNDTSWRCTSCHYRKACDRWFLQ
jgi:putative RecB family exonuclease